MRPHLDFTTRMTLLTIAALACQAMVHVPSVHAQSDSGSKPGSAPGPGSDKLDVTDLERKYWAAKDTDFSVVQNRLFSKAGRVALSLEYGTLINEPWFEGPTFGANLNYYFSERYGVEFAYSNTQAKDSEPTTKLKSNQGGAPNHGQLKGFYGAAFNWVPFYAKVSVLNSSIIYFDMSVSPGVGITEYEQQMEEGGAKKTAPTLTLDVTQHYFLNKWLALRFDFKNRWYQEDVVYYKASSVPAGADRKISTDSHHTSLLMFGFTLYY